MYPTTACDFGMISKTTVWLLIGPHVLLCQFQCSLQQSNTTAVARGALAAADLMIRRFFFWKQPDFD
jgi:hypothetical protein